MLTFKNIVAIVVIFCFASAISVAQDATPTGPMPDDEGADLANHVEIPIRLGLFEFAFPTSWYVGQVRTYQAELKTMERQIIMNRRLGPKASGVYRDGTRTVLN